MRRAKRGTGRARRLGAEEWNPQRLDQRQRAWDREYEQFVRPLFHHKTRRIWNWFGVMPANRGIASRPHHVRKPGRAERKHCASRVANAVKDLEVNNTGLSIPRTDPYAPRGRFLVLIKRRPPRFRE